MVHVNLEKGVNRLEKPCITKEQYRSQSFRVDFPGNKGARPGGP